MSSARRLVQVRGLRVCFHGRYGTVPAVDGVDLELARAETLCILGESGSGKSVTLRALMRLLPERVAQVSGEISVLGTDPMRLSPRQLAAWRGKAVAMIFQEPRLAFDPVFTIGQQMIETVRRHDRLSPQAARQRVMELCDMVQIPAAAQRLRLFPHELSGGLRQRAMIALALSCRPQLLLADEPTTALDVTVQIQILLLLRQLQKELGMSVILVTHDVGVAAEIADRVAVMYAGQFVETGSATAVLTAPRHPYTSGLLASSVRDSVCGGKLVAIPGAPPATGHIVAGCRFSPRCRYAQKECLQHDIPLFEPAPAHACRCVMASAANAETPAVSG